MTVASETNRSGPYNGNGSTTVFAYGFRILDEDHISVVSQSAAGVETTLTIGTHYTVSGVGSPSGGNVTMLTAPVTGSKLTIIRNLPFTQEVDLENQGAYFAETIEAALDASVMRDQQLEEKINRAVLVPVSSDGADLEGLAYDIIRLADSADNIDTVAGSIADVSAVAAIDDKVVTVADNIADVSYFSDVYLGPKTADPTLRNDGSALENGDMYFNTLPDNKYIAVYDGSAWYKVTGAKDTPIPSRFTGDGTDTTFTLPTAPNGASSVFVWLDGVHQQPVTDYTVSGVTLTMGAAPANGAFVDTLIIPTVDASSVFSAAADAEAVVGGLGSLTAAVDAAEASAETALEIVDGLGSLTAAVDAAEASAAASASSALASASSATSAAASASAAFTNGNVYADIATGRAAVADGQQFVVISGPFSIRYRRDTSSTQTEMARYLTADGVASNVNYAGQNKVADPLFKRCSAGVISLNATGSPNAPQIGLPNWFVMKAGTAGVSYPVTTVVDNEYVAAARTKRAIKTRQTRGSSGTTATDFQLKQIVPIPAAYLGRTDVEIRLVYFYKRASTNVDILSNFETYTKPSRNWTFSASLSNTKLSVDAIGAWSMAVFTATITDASAIGVIAAPRIRVPLTGADVDEDAFLGPIFIDFNRTDKFTYDRNGSEEIVDLVGTTFNDRLNKPWLDGSNQIKNALFDNAIVGANQLPVGYTASSGGAGTTGGAYEIEANNTPFEGYRNTFKVTHSNNGTVRTDRQLICFIDVPVEYHGDTTAVCRVVQYVKRTSTAINASVIYYGCDASGTRLTGALSATELTVDKGAINEWVALAYDLPNTTTLIRKFEIVFRTQVDAASGVVSGIYSYLTGLYAGWNKSASVLFYDRNFTYEVQRSVAATLAQTNSSDRWIDSNGNAHRVFPASRLGIWGDSQTDGMEEALIATVTEITGSGYGIGGEPSAQILARMQGYQASTAGITWAAGTIRLRAKRTIPPRTIDEAYRASWTSYAAKIAEANYVEFFNNVGRIGQSASRIKATATVSGDTWSSVGHSFADGDVVHFRDASFPANAYRYKPYYVRNVSGSTFKLSEFSGSAAISFSAFGGSVTWLGDFFFDWTYNGTDNNTITAKTHCPTDEDVVHLNVGTNDFGGSVTVAEVCANIQKAVAQIKTSRARFIISGIPGFWDAGGTWGIGGARYAKMMELSTWLAATYPDNWLDIYAYLLTQGDGGTNDNADIAAGYVPRSLRASSTDGHLNSSGQTKWAQQIKAAMLSKGWISA